MLYATLMFKESGEGQTNLSERHFVEDSLFTSDYQLNAIAKVR
jgi:hypothetical protein